jgi:hypothetical protein
MIDERHRPLPESAGALVLIAVRAYRRRFPLYFGIAFVGLLLEGVIAYLQPENPGFFYAGSIVVDSLISAAVTIGVIADMREGERTSDRDIALAAIAKWGLVAGVTAIVDYIEAWTNVLGDGSPDAGFGFMILPIAVLWGSIGFATVIAALDEKTKPLVLLFSSIGRSMTLAFARQNFGRLVALALVALLPSLVESILADQLGVRKIAGSDFMATIPIDAFVTGPLQAAFTIFYLDFVRRSSAGRN